MQFGPVPVADLEGAILAHSIRLPGRALKKGRRLDLDDVRDLSAAGVESVIAARLDANDVHEDEAARRVGEPLAGPGLDLRAPFTGRVNLYAQHAGVLTLDPAAVDRLNAVHEAVTLATLAPQVWVSARQMVATVKIIPFSAPGDAVAECERLAAQAALRVHAPQPMRVGLVQSRIEGATRTRVLDKTVGVLERRIVGVGATLHQELRCAHDAGAVAAGITALLKGGCDLVLVAGASAIVDRRDVIPSAIERAGGEVEYFGMPVDPGNLVLVGGVGETPVVGLPGCARSPAFNGFDWVLRRLVTGLPCGRRELAGMGVGGLLKEGSGRPSPREGVTVARAPRIAALVLAAGQSRRMGAENKLLAAVGDRPMVRRTVEAVLSSALDEVVVVTGHEPEQVRETLGGLDVRVAHNPRYAEGLSTSLAAGLDALDAATSAVVVCLGDMPQVDGDVIDRLLAAYDPVEGRTICVPTWRGKRGNPILFDARFFPAMRQVAGDVGARALLGENESAVCEVAVEAHAVLEDVDSPAELAALRSALQASAEAGPGAKA